MGFDVYCTKVPRENRVGQQDISTEIVPASEARQKLGQIMRRVYKRETRIIVEKGGIPVVAVVSLADLERWTRMDREREEHFKILDEIGEAFKDVPDDELEREVASAVAEAREKIREEAKRGAPAA
jgi:prevent-host-death family protein